MCCIDLDVVYQSSIAYNHIHHSNIQMPDHFRFRNNLFLDYRALKLSQLHL